MTSGTTGKRMALWSGIALACLVPAAVNAQSAPAATAREAWPRTGAAIDATDRAEIGDLMARYVVYADTGEGAAFAALFTPDGELAFGTIAIKGHAALAARISGKAGRTLHLAGAPLLVQTAPDRIKARSRLLFIAEEAAAAGGPAHRTMGFSMYADDIVRTRDGWRFARREAGDSIPLDPVFLTPGRQPASPD